MKVHNKPAFIIAQIGMGVFLFGLFIHATIGNIIPAILGANIILLSFFMSLYKIKKGKVESKPALYFGLAGLAMFETSTILIGSNYPLNGALFIIGGIVMISGLLGAFTKSHMM